MARVAIRKEDLERVVQVAERTAKRTNDRVIVAHDRVDLQDSYDAAGLICHSGNAKAVNFD